MMPDMGLVATFADQFAACAVTPDEVADCVLFALTRPPHVNIDEIVVKALAQSSGARVVRRET